MSDDTCQHTWLEDGWIPGHPYQCMQCGEHLPDPDDDDTGYVIAVLT